MGKKYEIEDILRIMGIEKGVYYINDEGKVMKESFPLDEFTGVFINDEGEIMREKFPVNEYTGLRIKKDGSIIKDGLLPEPTGFSIDDKGRFRKQGFILDDNTPYRIDDKGYIRKDSFIMDDYRVDTTPKPQVKPIKEEDFTEWMIKNALLLGLALFVLYMVAVIVGGILYYGIPVLPLLLLVFAFFKPVPRIIFSGLGVTAFCLYNILNRGFVYQVWGEQLYYPVLFTYGAFLISYVLIYLRLGRYKK